MVLEFTNVSFAYEQNQQPVINNMNFSIKAGELAVIEGKSGSGKSTFLHIAGLLASPQNGSVKFLGNDVQNKKQFILRRQMGYIFQSHMLWKDLSVLENVAMPLVLQGKSRKHAYKAAEQWIDLVELSKYKHTSVTQLSGGEQQRVGLARAFVHLPKLILADEPTGNLDYNTGDKIMTLCVDIARKNNIAIIYVTHNNKWNNMFDTHYHFDNGSISLVRQSS